MLANILDLCWPRDCEICGRPCDRPGRHVCSDCLMRLPFVPVDGCCRCCGRDVPDLRGDFLCDDCRGEDAPAFDRAASALRFEGEARQAVLDFKFKSHFWLRGDFVDWLEGVARVRFHCEEVDAVVPVPLTWRRWLVRGYNQSAILAAALAKRLSKPCRRFALMRLGQPLRQSSLEEADRRRNVKGTFAVRSPESVAGKTIMVLDDIMTTGATLSECAKVLKVAGAKRVWCVSLCRSVRV